MEFVILSRYGDSATYHEDMDSVVRALKGASEDAINNGMIQVYALKCPLQIKRTTVPEYEVLITSS